MPIIPFPLEAKQYDNVERIVLEDRMNKEVADEVMARFRYIILEYSRGRNISKVCREFNIPRSTFYNWRKRYDEEGPSGLYRKKACRS